MNVKKLFAIVLIWLLAAGAWLFLAQTIQHRTATSDEQLGQKVTALWGEPLVQPAPEVRAMTGAPLARTRSSAAGSAASSTEAPAEARATPAAADLDPVSISKSEVKVTIDANNRKKGLRWYPVYTVNFDGSYTLRNNTAEPQRARLFFRLPNTRAEHWREQAAVDGRPLLHLPQELEVGPLAPGASAVVTYNYTTTGTRNWTYELQGSRMVEDLKLTLLVNTPDYDFESSSSPPTSRAMTPDKDGRYTLVWEKSMVGNARNIVVDMPQKKQPGPLSEQISRFAPLSLFFFFVVMVTLQIMRRLSFHPMHYLFLTAAFFAFHLLLAYMVDHFDLHLSFWLASGVSILLAVMYLALVAGRHWGLVYAGLAQLVYLVLFSYSFFLEGWTGLTITIGSILTLAVLMAVTAKVRWGETLPELESKSPPAPPQARVIPTRETTFP